MTVDELILYLQELSAEGKGGYEVEDDGYGNVIEKDDIHVDEKWKSVVL